MTLARCSRFRATRRLDVKLRLLPGVRKLKNRGLVHFHIGSFDTTAEVALFERAELLAAHEAFAQLRLRQSVLAVAGDRFIIRQPSPLITIGGGTVLDPLARRPRAREGSRREYLLAVEREDKQEILAQLTERSLFGLRRSEIPARSGGPNRKTRAPAAVLAAETPIKKTAPNPPFFLGVASLANWEKKTPG